MEGTNWAKHDLELFPLLAILPSISLIPEGYDVCSCVVYSSTTVTVVTSSMRFTIIIHTESFRVIVVYLVHVRSTMKLVGHLVGYF